MIGLVRAKRCCERDGVTHVGGAGGLRVRVVRESRFLRVVRKRRESRFLRVVLREEV